MIRQMFGSIALAVVCLSAGSARSEGQFDTGESMRVAVESSLAGSAETVGAFGNLTNQPIMQNLRNGTVADSGGLLTRALTRKADKALAPVRIAI